MAFFKLRNSVDAPGAGSSPTQSLEGMRLRAIFRLIGAAVLVAAAIVGFPLVFDSQPRPIAVDVSIDIPDKAKVLPLAVAKIAPSVPPTSAPAPALTEVKAPEIEGKTIAEAPLPVSAVARDQKPVNKIEDKSPVKAEVKVEPRPDPKPDTKTDPKPASSKDDGAKVLALLEGKSTDTSNAARLVVQVGAFADAARAKDARTKLESAGLKTYTQVVDTKDGQRTRVRVGPFSDKQEADKVAAKIKSLGLSAAILSL